MTPTDVRARIAEIRAVTGDPEKAHGREDDLYIDVLTAIAMQQTDDPRSLAEEALKATDIGFPRWYA